MRLYLSDIQDTSNFYFMYTHCKTTKICDIPTIPGTDFGGVAGETLQEDQAQNHYLAFAPLGGNRKDDDQNNRHLVLLRMKLGVLAFSADYESQVATVHLNLLLPKFG